MSDRTGIVREWKNDPIGCPPNPVLASVFRGDVVEAEHRGVAIVVDGTGHLVTGFGDPERLIFPRSMMKPLQAVALVVSGASAHYGLSDDVLALAASSHFGEPEHFELLTAWAERMGVRPEDIECGAMNPLSKAAAANLVRSKSEPTVFHNNNCGKHLSLLTIAKHFGWSFSGYLNFDHPVQAYVRNTIEPFCDWSFAKERAAVDACGAPTEAIPTRVLAMALARMSDPKGLDERLRNGAKQILSAMTSRPTLTSGPGRLTSWLMEMSSGELVVKGGSEGGQAAISQSLGLAAIVKIDDGGHRAAEAAFIDLLREAEFVTADQHDKILSKYPREVYSYCGKSVTGKMVTYPQRLLASWTSHCARCSGKVRR